MPPLHPQLNFFTLIYKPSFRSHHARETLHSKVSKSRPLPASDSPEKAVLTQTYQSLHKKGQPQPFQTDLIKAKPAQCQSHEPKLSLALLVITTPPAKARALDLEKPRVHSLALTQVQASCFVSLSVSLLLGQAVMVTVPISQGS